MRRGKKAAVPACPPVSAFRRKASAKESEASGDLSSPESSSASESNSQGDPLQLLRPDSKAAPGKAEEPPSPPDSEPQEPPPLPPCSSDLLDVLHGTRVFTFQLDDMLSIFRSIPTQMDYKGQKLAEQIFQGIILVSAIIGFIYGYITEQFGWTVYIVMAGFALSCLLTLPPWPMYRRNPLKWLPVQESISDDKKPADRKVKRHPKN
ncbi:signal peptidase complex subunit 1 isoform X1 [Hemicordylus capensis]|uniref:signal peptidase complex subunit 1 isoform X1 n=1 Tax=Hemicordylus capensis TaxID=884348 RepID=UPI0023031A55|nr:signal peptidase complex subunit 1 isoform X1 [Hemicordylus capensis]